MKNSQFFMIATLSLMISVGAFSQNHGRERIKSPTSSMEVKQAMQERQHKAKEQKATQLREREAQRKEAEAKRSEMQEKMQPERRQMYQPERNAMPKATVRKKTTNNIRQKEEVSKLALDSIVYPEFWKETYRYDYYGRTTEYIDYNWGSSDWEPSQKYEYVYEGDIIREIRYNWNVSDWQPNSKYEYATDANDNQILNAVYNWDSVKWVGTDKYEYAYDANDNQIMEAHYDWISDKWVGEYKYTIEYNNDIKITINYAWDTVKSQWQNDEKHEYAENDYGWPLHNVRYTWDSTTNKWEGDYKYLHAYNSYGFSLLDERYDDWNDTTDTWIGSYKQVWAYDDNGNDTLWEHYSAWNYTTNTWIGNAKHVTAYDDNGNNILHEYYTWNDTAGTWIGNNKKVSAYDSDNNPLLEEFYNWSDSTGTWIKTDKYTYTYAHGMEFDKYYYVWNTDSNDWQEMEKTIGTIHTDGGISLRMVYQWNGSDWDTIEKWETMVYDTMGNMLETEVIFFTYTSPIWDKQQKIVYTWDTNDKWTEKIIYNYNSGTWEEYEKYEQNHDIYGNQTMEADYSWNGSAWVGNGYKCEYAYDTNGNRTMYADYLWSSDKWKGEDKFEWAYDANGNHTMEVDYNWNDSVWVENKKSEYDYDANGYQTLYAYYTWGDSVWVGYSKSEYGYDANGNQTMYAEYFWNSGKWEGNYRDEWVYDANGKLLFGQFQYDWDSTWKYGDKYVYAYDINGNQIQSEYSVWDTISRIWVEVNKQEWVYKDTYIYFTNDFPLYNRYYEWDGTAWELQFSTEWIYNTVGDIIEVVYSELFNDSLKVKTRMVTTTDTTHLRASLVFNEKPWDIMFSQHLRTDYYVYDSVETIISHDSVLYYWSSINVWSPPTYTISGTVTLDGNPLKDVKITYAKNKWETTNSLGEYTVSVDSGSTVVLTPSKTGYTFTPASITCPNVSSNLSNKDFQATDVGTSPTYTISGKVTVNGDPLTGVQITYAPSKSVTTNSLGEYTVSVDSGSTVVLKPSKAGYTFTPASITCPDVSGNLSNKDFQATKVGITDVDNTNTKLVVYPNPTKGIVYISSECDIKLYDIQGKKLQEIRGNQIDISSYPQGMYFLKVEGKTLKIVKE